MPQGLPFHLQDYVQLVDITGRAIREDKRGLIDNNLPPHSRTTQYLQP